MKAVDDPRRSAAPAAPADAGNDHRLGAQEAPPAIISIFLGDQLDGVVDQIMSTATQPAAGTRRQQLWIPACPPCPCCTKDATDRNRTSPFAFTGNKFEFRMVGSSDSIADCQHHTERHCGRGLLRGRRRAGEGRRL